MRWVLLLRAVNVGGNNKVPMKDLKQLLEDFGHTDVKSYLNSGNATFESSKRSAKALAEEVEKGLHRSLGVSVRACVRSEQEIEQTLERLPDLPGYVTISVLFDRPKAAALKAFLETDWSPETVAGDDQAIYIGYVSAAKSKLTITKLEKALGVSSTARTPATLRKMLPA